MAEKLRPGQKFSEDSFGENAKQVTMSRGSMFIIGQTVDDGQPFPSAKPTSVNQKSGWPGTERG